MSEFVYYDYHDLLSRNGTFNFIVSKRGNGKTYGAKKRVINNFLRNGEEFIYMRRFKNELADRGTWFTDIAHEWPDDEFRVSGSVAQHKNSDGKWVTMGYFVTLASSQAKKSVPYPKVTSIIFDEFILDRGMLHYLPEEVKAFNDFYQTVDRWKDKTRVYFLANSISIMNPYFLQFDIRPEPSEEWIVKHDGFVVCHFPDSEQFKNAVYETKFGKFIAGTSYGEYSIEGIFRDNSDNLLDKKDPTFNYYMTIETEQGAFSVWLSKSLSHAHISDKHPKTTSVWVLDPARMEPGKVLVPPNNKLLQMLRTLFGHGRITFNSAQARNAFIQIWKR